jgi:hypothetical protein
LGAGSDNEKEGGFDCFHDKLLRSKALGPSDLFPFILVQNKNINKVSGI